MQSLFLSLTLLLISFSLRQHPHSNLVKCTGSPSASKTISTLLKPEKKATTKILGIGILQGNQRLLVVIQETEEVQTTTNTSQAQLHSALLDLVEITPEGPLVVSSKTASLQSLSISPPTSALGGFILQQGNASSQAPVGWAQFLPEVPGQDGEVEGNITLDWYRHSDGVLEQVICTYPSYWMRDYVRTTAFFSSNKSGEFSYLSPIESELLPGSYSVTPSENSGPILSISSSYSPRRINSSNKQIEGGFILGRHDRLYALDNAHRLVYLYQLAEGVHEGDSIKTTVVQASAEIAFDSLIRFDDAGSGANNLDSNWLYLALIPFPLALIAFIAYACAIKSAKSLTMVNHFSTKSSQVGHTGGEIKKSREIAKLDSGTRLSSSSNSSTIVSVTPTTDTIDSSTMGSKKGARKTPTKKGGAPKLQEIKKARKPDSAVNRPVGSIFVSSL